MQDKLSNISAKLKLNSKCIYYKVLVWYKITIKGQIYMHCSLPSMTMTYSVKPSNDVTVLLMLICVNVASKLWQLELLKRKCCYFPNVMSKA